MGKITGATKPNGEMVFQSDEIDKVVLDHFREVFEAKSVPVDEADDQEINAVINEIDQMLDKEQSYTDPHKFEDEMTSPYTYSELEEILLKLPTNKSSGYDNIPNEFLKNAGPVFRQYLLVFLNRILEDGVIPAEMNKGKCVLIHKV